MRRFAIVVVLAGVLCALLAHRANAIVGFGPLTVTPIAAPANLPPVGGYSLWLDATNGSNTTSLWHDQSGSGRDATPQSTSPTLGMGINGLPSYNFTSTTGMVTAPYLVSFASGFTVAVVYQAITLQAGQNTEICASNGNYDISRGNGLFTCYDIFLGAGNTVVSGTVYSGAHIAWGSWSVAAGMSSAEDTTLLVNTANSSTPPASTEVRYVGSGPNGDILEGYIGEMIEWPFLLTTPQFLSVHTYLSAKWGTP